MVNLTVALMTFAITIPAEQPDKNAGASCSELSAAASTSATPR